MSETANRKQYDVVVAEDELLILENLVKKINSMSLPFCVKGAFEDGDSALEFIKTNHVDLVITDIKMPFMNGLELSRVLHASYPSIKILIISGYNEFTLAQEAIEYQVKGFLLKPIRQEQLEQALTKLLIELDSENDMFQASVPEHLKTLGKKEIADCVEKYLKENFQKQISMGDISDKLGFAPDYLSHLFKKYHDESPVRYLTALRINYAKQLLIRQPDLDVAVIGEMSGYPDPVYFSKVFKKNTGMWPSQYRAEGGCQVCEL